MQAEASKRKSVERCVEVGGGVSMRRALSAGKSQPSLQVSAPPLRSPFIPLLPSLDSGAEVNKELPENPSF